MLPPWRMDAATTASFAQEFNKRMREVKAVKTQRVTWLTAELRRQQQLQDDDDEEGGGSDGQEDA